MNKYIAFVTYQFYVTIYRDNFKSKYLTTSRSVLSTYLSNLFKRILLVYCRSVLIGSKVRANFALTKSFKKSELWTFATVSFESIQIPKKVFGGFDNIFHVYLMRGFQKYGRNWILMVTFWGQTKAGQKCAARWAEFAVLFSR